jgi:hypothetical protein
MEDDDVSVSHIKMVRTRGGRLLFFGSMFAGDEGATGYECAMVCSEDDGETWSKPKRVFTEPFEFGKPNGLGCGTTLRSGRMMFITSFGTTECETGERPTGRVSPYGFPVTEWIGRWGDQPGAEVEWRALLSDDEGETWRLSQSIPHLEYSVGGPLTQTPEGTVLLPVFGRREGAGKEEFVSNGFVRSDDEGETWSKPTIIAPWDKRLYDAPGEMSIVVLPDGRWVALYRNQFTRDDYNSTGVFLYRSYSYDQGKNWTVGQQIFPNAGCATSALLPDGALLVVMTAWGGAHYAVSNSGGETWDYQNLLWGIDPRYGGGCAGFSIVALGDGRMLIAYNAKVDRSIRLANPFSHHYKMRLEIAWLKKVKADSAEGRMR